MNPKEINPDIKNVRLHMPREIYERVKKCRAQRILKDLPDKSIAGVCLILIEKGLRAEDISYRATRK